MSMANSKIYLGTINIGSLYEGASDVSIYLGVEKVYPLAFKLNTMINGQKALNIGCTSGNTTISSAETHPSTAYTLYTSAAIGECVDTIGDGAFSGYTSMTGITIPDTITSIGNYAFQTCLYLSDYSMPSGVTSIGSNAFNSCEHITSIVIPDSVTSIGNYAFYACKRATSLSIGSGLTNIGDNVFYNCTGLTSVNVPDTITSIGSGSFQYCRGLNSINIGNGVTTIGYYAFNTCSSATSVSIGSGVTTIRNEAFAGCSALTSITINAITPPTLGSNVFYNTNNCPIYVPCESVDAYKAAWTDYASRITCVEPVFEGKWIATYQDSHVESAQCDASSAITYNEINRTNLVSVEIGNCVTSINSQVFQNCTSLTSCTIGSGVTSIGNQVFWNCTGLTSVNIPDGVVTIGSIAFEECSGITSLDIPSSITSIGDYAFNSCRSLTSITVNATTPPTLGAWVFNNTNNCPIYVPCDSVDAYKAAWTDYASRITCVEPVFEGKWKATYSDSHTESAQCDSSSEIRENEINQSNIVSVEIGDCVTSIGYRAFRDCSGLTSIDIPDSVTSIGGRAFQICKNLTSIDIPSGVTFIGDYAFGDCYKLSNITIPSGFTYINDGMFQKCSGLTSIDIPSGVTSIGTNSFSNCSSLTSVNIPSGVTSIGTNSFSNCSSLTSITINATTPPSLGSAAFRNTNECPIYVPCESVNHYKMAPDWSGNAYRVMPINNYFRFIAREDGEFKLSGNTIEYSTDCGNSWYTLYSDTYSPLVSSGSTIMFKATNPTIISNNGIGRFYSTGQFDVEGNIMSLIAGDDFETATTITTVGQFRSLFDSNDNVINASGLTLPATAISQDAYRSMFLSCRSLVTAPKLPATTLGESCYKYMFRYCSSLTTAPTLPATNLAQSCYAMMFQGCTSLTSVPNNMLQATTMQRQCYEYMFSGCTSLTIAPQLPAPTLEYQSYRFMFNGCTSLRKITCLATDISATQCTNSWVTNVASSGTFIKKSSMTSWTTDNNGIPANWTVQDG